MFDKRPYTFDRVVRIVFTLAIVAVIVYLLDVLKGVLLPFCMACLVAYMLEPIVLWNKRLLHCRGRYIPIAMTLVEMALVVGVLGYLFIPSIFEELHQMGTLLSRYADQAEMHIPFLPDGVHEFLRSNFDIRTLASDLSTQDIETILSRCLQWLSGGLDVVLGLVGWLVVFLYVIFIMIDYDRLMLSFRLMVPPKYRRSSYRIGRDIKRAMNHYFRGQALIALIVAVIYAVGFSIVGLPLGVLVGLMNGVLFMVPYMVYVSLVPVTILCIVYAVDQSVDFWTVWWGCIAVYAVAQVTADMILTPKIMGKAMGMNPAIILLSLSVWGTLLGFLGMIIAIPLTALLLSYYEEYILHRTDGTSPSQRRLEEQTVTDIANS